MRMIEEFTGFLAKILRLKRAKNYDAALKLIDELLSELLGLTTRSINSVSNSYLISMLSLGGALDVDKCIMLAVLLKEEADVCSAQHKMKESDRGYQRSLNFFLEAFVSTRPGNLSEYFVLIKEVISKLDSQRLSTEIRDKLFRYYEKTGDYAKAEDVLFELLQESNPRSDILEKGILFYQRLTTKSDADLVAGNLPRDEILEGLSKLSAVKKN